MVSMLGPLLRRNSAVVLQRLDSASLGDIAANIRWAQPDLGTGELPGYQFNELIDGTTRFVSFTAAHATLGAVAEVAEITDIIRRQSRARSEEHTSELQSRGHLVCRLLLEKKKHKHCHSFIVLHLYCSPPPHPSSRLFPYTTLFRSSQT